MSISPSSIKSFSLLLLMAAVWLPAALSTAQGHSIPRGSEASQENASPPETAAQPLPEGQKYRYPKINHLEVAFDLASPVMELFTYDYGEYAIRTTLDIYHRFLPQLVLGIGHCNESSEDAFFTYKVSPSFFVKAGMGYNFKYNDIRPDDYYWIFARYGFSTYKADITDITYNDGYWEAYGPVTLNGIGFTCHWIEIGAGIHVQVWKKWALGWEIWYRNILAKGTNPNGDPYYIPGYGSRASHIGFSFNISYDIF